MKVSARSTAIAGCHGARGSPTCGRLSALEARLQNLFRSGERAYANGARTKKLSELV